MQHMIKKVFNKPDKSISSVRNVAQRHSDKRFQKNSPYMPLVAYFIIKPRALASFGNCLVVLGWRCVLMTVHREDNLLGMSNLYLLHAVWRATPDIGR